MTTTTEVVQLQRTQISEAGELLARAFHDDPLFMWVLPDESKRARVLPWFMAFFARYCRRYGEVHTTAESVEGTAVWVPPGRYPMSVTRLMLAGWILAPAKLGPRGYGRMMGAVKYWEKLHKRDVPPRHWYLMILGVDPPRQGEGIGGALLQPVLARADGEGVPCYLETVTARNVPSYQRHGFAVVVEGDLRKGGPHFWTMKREPVG